MWRKVPRRPPGQRKPRPPLYWCELEIQTWSCSQCKVRTPGRNGASNRGRRYRSTWPGRVAQEARRRPPVCIPPRCNSKRTVAPAPREPHRAGTVDSRLSASAPTHCHQTVIRGGTARFVIDLAGRVEAFVGRARHSWAGMTGSARTIDIDRIGRLGRVIHGREVVMITPIATRAERAHPLGLRPRGLLPNFYDVVVFFMIAGAFVALAHGAREMQAPLASLDFTPVTLDPANLPGYALLTTLRMFAAIIASLLFTFVVATLAAKSHKAELVIIPALDILQSVPVLGFLTFTVVFFMRLFPASELGAELAAIFAIFTAQAWNMAFSFYQSLRTVPADLDEVSRHFQLSPWLRFWRLEVPFAAPGLIWNTMMSMSGGWFFVVASEAVSVGNTTFKLPGIGSWLALAIEEKDIGAVALAVATMAAVILAYDQLVFRPIVAWADKFRFEQTAAQQRPQSWVYDIVRRAQLFKRIFAFLDLLCARISAALPRQASINLPAMSSRVSRATDLLWIAVVFAAAAFALWHIVDYMRATLGPADVVHAFALGMLTLTRV